MPEEKEYLTQEKYDQIKEELDELKTKKRKEIAEQLEYAKSLGDLSENAEYHEARDAQANLEDRIARLEGLLKHASIVSKHDANIVSVGSEITVEYNGKKLQYTLVGTEEANISEHKISIKSPFGKAAQGKKKGDEMEVETPNGKVKYKIIDLK